VASKGQIKEILDRVLTWPEVDQEKVARFARQIEQWRDSDDLTDEEWLVIEERAARRDLASDEEVEAVFSRYRMKLRYERGALADLEEIFAYIAKDNRTAAAQLVARIEQATAAIAQQPHGRGNPQREFRRFPVGNYLIVYDVCVRCTMTQKYFLFPLQRPP
jgi:plasmid stabilization system protein ParE